LIVDPQEDFCHPKKGTLYVPGAERDMARLAGFLDRLGERIESVTVTLDSHHLPHIAHAIFWTGPQGESPAPFSIISPEDVRSGKWRPRQSTWVKQFPGRDFGALDYLERLETGGRYPLRIWPPHCLIGSPGHAVFETLHEALLRWEGNHLRPVDYLSKGSNCFTEHYSILQAEVQDSTDITTLPNQLLLDALRRADLVLLAGEAGSHCVGQTLRDLARHDVARQQDGGKILEKLIFLSDATSPVAGFEQQQAEIFEEMLQLGMRLLATDTITGDALPKLSQKISSERN